MAHEDEYDMEAVCNNGDTRVTLVNGSMLPQYIDQEVAIFGKIISVSGDVVKLNTTDNITVVIVLNDGSLNSENGYLEVRGTVLNATNVRSKSYVFFEETAEKIDDKNYNNLCSIFQAIPTYNEPILN